MDAEVVNVRATRSVIAAVAILACREPAAASALPESGELACERPSAGQCDYDDARSGLHFRWPRDWPMRRLRLLTEAGPPAQARRSGALRWLAVQYQPEDATQPEAALFHVAVLPLGEWLEQSLRPQPLDGVEVATDRRHVVIATRTAPNPYPIGSRDADIFDALMPGLEEISRTVSLVSQR